MRILRDVVVQRTAPSELQAVSQLPGVSGEEMTLDLLGAGTTLGLRVRVIESRPVMVAGAVRHRIRLELLGEIGAESGAAAAADGFDTAEVN